MIWDWVEGDALICEKRRDPVPVSWTQSVPAEGIGSLLEGGTRYVVDCEGDVPLCTHLTYISGTSLEEQNLAPADLEDCDIGLVVTEQVEELMCELGSPHLDG